VTPPTPAELDALATLLAPIPVYGPALAAAVRLGQLAPAALRALEHLRGGMEPDEIRQAVGPDLRAATEDLL
jgi:hypothetical protein